MTSDQLRFTLLLYPIYKVCLNQREAETAKDRMWAWVAAPPEGHLIVNVGKNLQVKRRHSLTLSNV